MNGQLTAPSTAPANRSIDLGENHLEGFSRNDHISEEMRSSSPVDLQGRDANFSLAESQGDQIGYTDEVGVGPNGYRDNITNVFKVDSSRLPASAEEYISTFAVAEYGCFQTSPGPEETKGYVMQLALGNEYKELLILPDRRALAEALHHAAVNSFRSGHSLERVELTVCDLARRLGVQVLA